MASRSKACALAGAFLLREKGEHMTFTEEEEGKLRAIIAIFDGQAPSLSSDVAAKCPALFAEWDGDGHAYAEGERVRFEGVFTRAFRLTLRSPIGRPRQRQPLGEGA